MSAAHRRAKDFPQLAARARRQRERLRRVRRWLGYVPAVGRIALVVILVREYTWYRRRRRTDGTRDAHAT